MKKIITLALIVASLATTLSAHASLLVPKIDREERKTYRTIENVERDLNRHVFAYKGEWIAGVTASYFTFSAENSDFLLFIDNIDANFGMTSIKPFVGYLYRNNHALGMRFGYSYVGGTIETARIDLGDENDIQFEIPYISSRGSYYTASVFHRSYTALDRKGHFGLFAEVELSTTNGKSTFEYDTGENGIYTRSHKTSVDLSFNPGLSVFIMDNISTSVSFEFGGLNYTSIKQYDRNGDASGDRTKSSMNFNFNFLAINLGLTVHIWK